MAAMKKALVMRTQTHHVCRLSRLLPLHTQGPEAHYRLNPNVTRTLSIPFVRVHKDGHFSSHSLRRQVLRAFK